VKNRNLDVLLKVRKAKQSQALAALGVERVAVAGLAFHLEEASSNLAELLLDGRRRVEDMKFIAAQRSSSVAFIRQINDSLMLAQLRAENARLAWLATDQDREISQRLLDREQDAAELASDRAERLNSDERARSLIFYRKQGPTKKGKDS
jgi:flagellar biosynthesis chaperone FliJ